MIFEVSDTGEMGKESTDMITLRAIGAVAPSILTGTVEDWLHTSIQKGIAIEIGAPIALRKNAS